MVLTFPYNRYDMVRHLLLASKSEDYPYRPIGILSTCFVLNHMLYRKIHPRLPNLELLQAKHINF